MVYKPIFSIKIPSLFPSKIHRMLRGPMLRLQVTCRVEPCCFPEPRGLRRPHLWGRIFVWGNSGHMDIIFLIYGYIIYIIIYIYVMAVMAYIQNFSQSVQIYMMTLREYGNKSSIIINHHKSMINVHIYFL